jgi:hypothetical protein
MGFKKLRDEAFAKDLFNGAKISSNTGDQKKTTALLDHNIKTYWASTSQENTADCNASKTNNDQHIGA